jgi:hypothetical protein
MNEWRRLCGEIRLVIPARRASRFTVRSAAERSIRSPLLSTKIGPSTRSPTYGSSARAVRGASGIVTRVPPLRTIRSVRCPRSMSRSAMSAPSASEIRSPFIANNTINA